MVCAERLVLVVRAFDLERVSPSLLSRSLKTLWAAAKSVPQIERTVLLHDAANELPEGRDTVSARKWQSKHQAVISIDARAITFTSTDLSEIADAYLAQSRGERRPVICVEPVPSQFHPLKILSLGSDGVLTHYRDEGRAVFQRQQIEADRFWAVSDACWVGDACIPPDPKFTRVHRLRWPHVLARDERSLALATRILEEQSRQKI